MPFTQFMAIPVELTLRTGPEGVRLYRQPVKEIQRLYRKTHQRGPLVLKPGENPLADIPGELFDIELEFQIASANLIHFQLHGQTATYDAREQRITALGCSAPLAPIDGRVKLRILVDRSIIEVFGNDGQVSMSCYYRPTPEDIEKPLSIKISNGQLTLPTLTVSELNRIWG
jgi:sucrose-6-phosphate hydrolase SacC (GH32 family)